MYLADHELESDVSINVITAIVIITIAMFDYHCYWHYCYHYAAEFFHAVFDDGW